MSEMDSILLHRIHILCKSWLAIHLQPCLHFSSSLRNACSRELQNVWNGGGWYRMGDRRATASRANSPTEHTAHKPPTAWEIAVGSLWNASVCFYRCVSVAWEIASKADSRASTHSIIFGPIPYSSRSSWAKASFCIASCWARCSSSLLVLF